ncbi:MAG: chromosome partitioning protein ParB [Candidatus Hydrogenedentota bacterium]
MLKPKKGGLGRGLGALIPGPSENDAVPQLAEPQPVAAGGQVLQLDPHTLKPNPKQPRRSFNEETLNELADSIRRDGVFEPIIVRQVNGGYEIVSGERRVRASILAGLSTVPAIVRDVSDSEMLKFGLIENIQREDLNPIELAHAYQTLISELGWTQEQMAVEVGKKRATITNTMRLLQLPESVQRGVAEGAISMGHARALLALPTAREQIAACKAIIERGLSVRQVEKMAAPDPARRKAIQARNPNIVALEDELRHSLGTRVALRPQGKDMTKGKIEIEYYSLDDLDRILDILRNKNR